MPRPTWRFSLRALLIAAAVIPPAAYYWFILPTRNAQEFVSAVDRADFAATGKLDTNRNDPFPGRWQRHQVFQPRAVLVPLTWQDVCFGRRQVELTIVYGDDGGLAGVVIDGQATARGVRIQKLAP